jgi:hypothetical protein
MTTTQTMGELIDQFEAELLAKHKALTPEQLVAEQQRRKAKADYEAAHTPIETDEDRADTDEYSDDVE